MNGGGGSFDDPQQLEGENHGEDDFGITACILPMDELKVFHLSAAIGFNCLEAGP